MSLRKWITIVEDTKVTTLITTVLEYNSDNNTWFVYLTSSMPMNRFLDKDGNLENIEKIKEIDKSSNEGLNQGIFSKYHSSDEFIQDIMKKNHLISLQNYSDGAKVLIVMSRMRPSLEDISSIVDKLVPGSKVSNHGHFN